MLAQDCLTPPQMRAMTIALADITAGKLVSHCGGLAGGDDLYLSKEGAAISAYFGPLRGDANAILIGKYAPFLGSKPDMAASVIDPILATIIDQFAISDLDSAGCMQVDVLLEGLHALPANQTAELLTIIMSRQAAMQNAAAWLKACPVDTE
ncbi:MAG: hypothetical protein AAF562_09610 [Pseudomonadota bacterium]